MEKEIKLTEEEIEVIKLGLGLFQKEIMPAIYSNNPVQFKDAKQLQQYQMIKKDLDNISSALKKLGD